MKRTWIFDVETLANLALIVFLDKDSDEHKLFVFHKLRNDYLAFCEFTSTQIAGLIGFNNLSFDNPVMDEILINNPSPEAIYSFAQKIIQSEKVYHKPLFRSLDLFKLWHFDNAAKRTSLKELEFVMRRERILDMPIPHNTFVESDEQIDIIADYCLEDCKATKQFYEISKDKIKLRHKIGKKYGIDLLNASDSAMGEAIFTHYISQSTGIPAFILRKGGTDRTSGVAINDILLPYLDNFTAPEFNELLARFKSLQLYDDSSFSDKVVYNNMQYDYGKGGVHGAIRKYYESTDTHVIKTCDVTSYYPFLAIANTLYPEHIGEVFCEVYLRLFEERKKYPKGTDENYALKIALNAVFGKTNDKWSWLRDLRYFYSITINGQLSLSLLANWYTDAGFDVIMINTDGMETIVPRHKEKEYIAISQKWMKLTGLQLEFDTYAKLLCRDVNNYLAITEKGSVKQKGAYEIDKDYWKDHSFRIIPIAVSAYFIEGIPIEDIIEQIEGCVTIGGKTYRFDLYDYLGRVHVDSRFEMYHISLDGNECKRTPLSKTTRYYVSKRIGKIMKRTIETNTLTKIQADWNTQPLNIFRDIRDDLKLEFYKKEARKLIEHIEITKTQQSLF